MKTKRYLCGLSTCTFIIAAICNTQANATLFDCASVAGMCIGEGDTVTFQFAHTLDPNGNDYMGLFGQLQYSGDTVFVTPTDFRAESIDGATVFATETGTIQVLAKQGYVLDGINVGETGSYKMSGGGTSVDVDAYLRVFDWLDPVPGFGTEEDMYLATSDLSQQGTDNPVTWNASGGFDLTTSMWNGLDHVGLTLQNILTAQSTTTGQFAWIQKTAVGSEIIVSTSAIPIPAAVWLFGSGLVGLIGIARRKQA